MKNEPIPTSDKGRDPSAIPTPRTDALSGYAGRIYRLDLVVPADFAHTLERENSSLEKAFGVVTSDLQDCQAENEKLRSDLALANQKLAAALRSANVKENQISRALRHSVNDQVTVTDLRAQLESANQRIKQLEATNIDCIDEQAAAANLLRAANQRAAMAGRLAEALDRAMDAVDADLSRPQIDSVYAQGNDALQAFRALTAGEGEKKRNFGNDMTTTEANA